MKTGGLEINSDRRERRRALSQKKAVRRTKPSVDMILEYRIITPAVIGGYDNKNGDASLRLSSFMGALRFWWRALALARANGNVQKVLEWQADLFGSAADTSNASALTLRATIETIDLRSSKCGPPRCGYETSPRQSAAKMGLGYLANQGFKIRARGETVSERQALRPGGRFRIKFTVYGEGAPRELSRTTQPGRPTLVDALLAMDLCGGVGARSRRGFGAVQIAGVEAEQPDLSPIGNQQDLTERLNWIESCCSDFGKDPAGKDVSYSAFSRFTEFAVLASAGSVVDFHAANGAMFQAFRSNGNSGFYPDERLLNGKELPLVETASGEIAPRFWDDHQLFKDAVQERPFDPDPRLPARAVFGLPHPYYSNNDGLGLKIPASDAQVARRSSPLFLTLREIGEDQERRVVAVWTCLRSAFLDQSVDTVTAQVHAGRKNIGASIPLRADVDWSAISTFLSQVRAISQDETGTPKPW